MSLIIEDDALAKRMEPAVSGRASSATLADYVALTKPRVMSLVMFTAVVGLAIAPAHPHPLRDGIALLCIAAGAAAAGALNMWYDADIDALMARTAGRPIPGGRIARREALALGVSLAAASVAGLALFVNGLSAVLLAATIAFYVVVYTMWLKRSTPQNIVIGGLAGAVPPLIGWTAATGHIAPEPLALVLVIFLWTPPHFWALSLWRARDYARSGIPMLPVVAGPIETRRRILRYALALAPSGALPWLLGNAGVVYGAFSLAAGAGIAALAFALHRSATDAAAKRLFGWSIIYLFFLFAALLLDSRLGPLLALGAAAR
ncbi:MAG TPA: heme o synthase [Xanthobacteraceae bacterium]|nr:heme o synthase [Xanthobacteraceae bacterium]